MCRSGPGRRQGAMAGEPVLRGGQGIPSRRSETKADWLFSLSKRAFTWFATETTFAQQTSPLGKLTGGGLGMGSQTYSITKFPGIPRAVVGVSSSFFGTFFD